jgi:hypothetical protein
LSFRTGILGLFRQEGIGTCVTTVESLTHEFVINRPDTLDGDRERFIEEVTRLIAAIRCRAVPFSGPL